MAKRVNKFLISFFLFVMLFVYGAWELLRSDFVAEFISAKVSEILSKQEGHIVTFENLEVNPIDLGVSVENVIFESKDFSGVIDEIEFSFGMFSFFKSKVQLDKIHVKGAVINAPDLNKANDETSEEKEPLGKQIKSYIQVLFENKDLERFRKLSISNSSINVGKSSFYLDKFLFHNFKLVKVISGQIRPRGDVFREYGINGLEVNASISKSKITIEPILIRAGLDRVLLKSEIVINKNGIILTSGTFDFLLDSARIGRALDFRIKGVLSGSGSFGGPLSNISVQTKVETKKIDSEFLDTGKTQFSLSLDNGAISLLQFESKLASGIIKLKDSVSLYDLNANTENSNNLNFFLSLHKVESKYLLKSLESSLAIMRLNLSGNVNISLQKQFSVIDVKLEKGVLHSAVIGADSDETKIITLKEIELEKFLFNTDLEKDEFKLALESSSKHFKVRVNGENKNGKGFYQLRGEMVDLNTIGNIAGVKLEGKGKLDLDINSGEDTEFDISLKMFDFGVADFYLGETDAKINYSIQKKKLSILEVKSTPEESEVILKGNFDLSSSEIYLDISHPNTSLQAVQRIFEKYIPQKIETLDEVIGSLELSYIVQGPIDLEKLSIKGALEATNLSLQDTHVKNLKTSFLLNEGKMKISNLTAGLYGGELVGRYEYHLINDYQDIDVKLTNISVASIPYLPPLKNPLKGVVNIEGYGAGRPEDFNLKVGVDVLNLKISNRIFRNNYLDLNWENQQLSINSSFFDTQVSASGMLNFSEKVKKNSWLKLDTNFKSLNPFFYAINTNLVNRQSALKSRLNSNFEIQADLVNLKLVFLKAQVNDFYLRHHFNTLAISPKNNRLLFRDGKIEESKLELVGTNKYVRYSLLGVNGLNFYNRYEVDLPASILELVIPETEVARGRIVGDIKYHAGNKNYFSNGTIELKEIDFRPKGLPISFNDLQGKLTFNKHSIYLEELVAEVEKGRLFAEGEILLSKTPPSVYLKFHLDNSLIVPFENTKFLLSGSGVLKGKKFPYLIDGKIVVYHSEVNESLDKLSESGEEKKTQAKYLPQRIQNKKSKFVNTNFEIDFIKPLLISNDLFDIALLGRGVIKGDVDEVKFVGQFRTSPKARNVISLKGHEFIIINSDIQLKENQEESVFLVTAKAKIKEYEVFLNVSGPQDKIKVTLTSEPALPKEDIFSLITFGYTTKTSRELKEDDRTNIATVGIGSLIFDQLKIGKGLNSSLGLRVAISPEFVSSQESLLEGKSAVGNSRRLRSATRIKLEKSFSDSVDMSFSNTVGGAVQQRQEMNVIYKVNDNFSIDGVLQVNEIEEENAESQESIGADLKYKWSF